VYIFITVENETSLFCFMLVLATLIHNIFDSIGLELIWESIL